MKQCGKIYCFTSPSGKSYIGQTWMKSVVGKTSHTSRYKSAGEGACGIFAAAIKKYGFENFRLTVVEDNIMTQVALDEAEEFFIAYLQTMQPNGYNLTGGGRGGLKSVETRRRLSTAATGRKHTTASREKISAANAGPNNPMYGVVRTAESKQRMSDAQRGKARGSHSLEHCQKIAAALRGRTVSAETRQKQSVQRKGRVPWNKGKKGSQVAWNKGLKRITPSESHEEE